MEANIERLKAIFEEMSQNEFDTSVPLKWGFFFFDRDKNKLLKVYEELKEKEYTLDGIEKMDDQMWRLFVTKVEILTPEKLHKRNLAFNELAEYCSVSIYDGWDVEKLNSVHE